MITFERSNMARVWFAGIMADDDQPYCVFNNEPLGYVSRNRYREWSAYNTLGRFVRGRFPTRKAAALWLEANQ